MNWNIKRMFSVAVILLFIGSIFYYAYFQSRGIIAGPTITLLNPHDGDEIFTPLLHVRGKVERAKELTLDGRGIFVDLSGNFDEQLLLFPGYNIIELAAKDADGREERKTVGVIWSGTTSPALLTPPISSSTNRNASETDTINY